MIHVVILAGGSGTRFWPLSRELYPKQVLQIVGKETMIQRAFRCASLAADPDRIWVATSAPQSETIQMQLLSVWPKVKERCITEPQGRNTAPAVGLAALRLVRNDPEAIMLIMPADHIIRQPRHFERLVRQAVNAADRGRLVTFGIRPLRPETGYGYIKTAGRKGTSGIREVDRFVEKPDLKTAKRYVRSGGYFWNSGIFLWRADVILEEIRRCQPKLHAALMEINSFLGTPQETERLRDVYSKIRPLSIDYGVLERSRLVSVLPADIGWCDVGSWAALDEVADCDDGGNIHVGRVVDIESRNSIVYANKRLVATIGLEDMVVVDTEDATLVCPKSRSQDVKKVVDRLKKDGADESQVHRTVHRPWGSFTVLEEGPGYKIKRLVVNPGARLSLQLHNQRSEHWVVVSGVARVTRNDEVYDVKTNESTYIPKGAKHRIENPADRPTQIIEVQNGAYLGEDDIVRFEDVYGRV
jgi:mannose-1-phosphate guanylyltransferase/mannose-6-phosphate isomerase